MKNKTVCLGPPFVKFQNSKCLQHLVDEAMESEAHGHDSDSSYEDVDFEDTSLTSSLYHSAFTLEISFTLLSCQSVFYVTFYHYKVLFMHFFC